MKNLIPAVAVSTAIGFVVGGMEASTPPAEPAANPAPPLPVPGVYLVTETAATDIFEPYDWSLSDCGPRCLHVLSHSPGAPGASWDMDLPWVASADDNQGAWVGEHTNPGMVCDVDTPEQHQTGPVKMKYIIRPDLTGFVNMGFSHDNPSCAGDTEPRSRNLVLRRAPMVWS